MNYKFTIILSIITSCLFSQILWNEPPDTIWYGYQSRWVEVILPQPTPLKATTINYNEVKLTFDTYWTQEFIDAYIDKFGYAPIPNRYSFYRNGFALIGVPIHDNEYIDKTAIYGETYSYKYLASDTNYQNIGGLQHWSPRSNPTNITVGSSLSSLFYPTNFNGKYNTSLKCIDLMWDTVGSATSYNIFKSHYNNYTQKWIYDTIQYITECKYQDLDILEYTEYLYSISSVSGSNQSGRSSPIAISTLSFDFGAPNNFTGVYMPDNANILLSWDLVSGAGSYQIFKSFIDPNTHKWQYLTLNIGNVNEYSDVKLFPNLTYFYQILSVSGGNKSNRSNTIMVTSGTLRIANEFILKQNVPNPFNPSTEIEYSLPFDSFVTITIYDLMGSKVKILLNNFQTTGNYSINWDGTNNIEKPLAGGIYFYNLQAEDFYQTRKMVLLK